MWALRFCLVFDVCSSILQHKDAYQVILDGVKGGPKEKRLAAQFIPKFFSSFPEMADAAINAQLDLCEDEDVSVSIYRLCPRISDFLSWSYVLRGVSFLH